MGSEGEGDGQFLHPHIPANDAQGKLFVTDRNIVNVQVFTIDGQFVKEWGFEDKAEGKISKPESVIVDFKGDVYIANYGNDRIQKFTIDGAFLSK